MLSTGGCGVEGSNCVGKRMRTMPKARSVMLHQIGLWMGSVAKASAVTKYVHPQEVVEQRVPIVWGNGCHAEQEDDV